MSPSLATLAFIIFIAGLFWLDRDKKARTSLALWIPVIWVSIVCSRTLSTWLQIGSPLDSADTIMDGNPIDRAVYSGLLAAGILVLLSRGPRIGKLMRANRPILLFFGFCAVSLLWSDYPEVAVKRWIKAVGDLAMIMIVLSDRDPLAAFKKLLTRATFTLIPLSILFIKYYPNLGRDYGFWDGELSYLGVTTNKNTLGTICLCFGLGALWRLLLLYREREAIGRTRRMVAQILVLSMVLWLFRIINSMTSLSSFLMGCALLIAMNWDWVKRRPMIIHVMLVSMVAFSASVVFLGFSSGALKTMGRNPTLTGRTEVWNSLLKLSQNSWVGTGFESFWLGPRLQKMWSLYWWHPNQAHNGYLEVFLNLGWLGIVLLAFVLLSRYWTVFKAWRNNVPTASLGVAYFLVGLVFNFTEAAFFRMQAPAWIFLLLAITSYPMPARKPRPTTESPETSFWTVAPQEPIAELVGMAKTTTPDFI